MSKDRSYGDDEVRAIIERALKAQPASGVSHEELLAIGAGVGLSRAALESAAREVTDARLTETATARIVSRKRRCVLAHAFVYLTVNGFLFAINFMTTPGQWWVLFPIFAWGIGMLLHAGFGLFSRVSDYSLTQEKRRLLKAARTGVNQLVERQKGVRIAAQAAQLEEPNVEEAESESASDERSARGQ
jgi:succinate dehydrogenase hydrophobic anchor subunit